MKILASEIVRALLSYAGPLDDPRIGWIGRDASRSDLFKCERCGEEHENSTKIKHKPGCSAADLLVVMQSLRTLLAEPAAQPVAVPDGMALVPVEPTPEMKAAPANDRPGFSHNVAREVYAAMLAAAPKGGA